MAKSFWTLVAVELARVNDRRPGCDTCERGAEIGWKCGVADNLEDAALVLLVEGVDEAGEIEGAESGRLAAMTSFI